jgi:hypothetical protein
MLPDSESFLTYVPSDITSRRATPRRDSGVSKSD